MMKLESYNKGLERRAKEAGRAIDSQWIKENESNDMVYRNNVKTTDEMREEIDKLKADLNLDSEILTEIEKDNFEIEKDKPAIFKLESIKSTRYGYEGTPKIDEKLGDEEVRIALEEAKVKRKPKNDIEQESNPFLKKIEELNKLKKEVLNFREEDSGKALEDAMNKAKESLNSYSRGR